MLDISTKVREVEGIAGAPIPGDILAGADPVILRGQVADWPSVQAGRDRATDVLGYLRSYAREQDILAFRSHPAAGGRYFYNDDFTGFNFDRVTAPLGSLLDQLEPGEPGADERFLYMGSTSVDECFPGFREHNDIALGEFAAVVSIWMGSRSRIAAHFDAPDNIACVVAGRRRFTLFPPQQLPNLYVGPLDFTPAGQAISLVDFADPDYQRYPRFREALAAARVAEMEPGDALFVPSMWWHHVEALDPFNVLVNYWWNSSRHASGNPLNALIHALLSIKGLPPEQRRAWQGLFEHYVFEADAQNFAHIPQQNLGVLGEMDASTLRQLRQLLRGKLAG